MGAPEKNATLIYLRGCIPIQRIFYFIVGIPLVLCSTFVGKSLQVYLVLEKSFNFKPTIFKFLHDDYYIVVWTSINFNSRIPVFRPVFAASKAISRTQHIINTSWIYIYKYFIMLYIVYSILYFTFIIYIPVVPHKAVAEVSRIRNV